MKVLWMFWFFGGGPPRWSWEVWVRRVTHTAGWAKVLRGKHYWGSGRMDQFPNICPSFF